MIDNFEYKIIYDYCSFYYYYDLFNKLVTVDTKYIFSYYKLSVIFMSIVDRNI